LEIQDTGMGIPLTELDRIFDMFYQLEEHLTRASGGLGMGLAIARRGVELHGGGITVESTLGQGSLFRITLPPFTEHTHIPPQTRLDAAHQQTLAYGHDLARAFARQQALTQRINHMSELGSQLLACLEQLSLSETEEGGGSRLDEARTLAHRLLDQDDMTRNRQNE
jgi:hypothetical protein